MVLLTKWNDRVMARGVRDAHATRFERPEINTKYLEPDRVRKSGAGKEK
jgi:hypothetical protein